MNVKILNIRLNPAFIVLDQKIVDQFLAQHEIIKYESAFVKNEEYWSVILYYKELKSKNKETESKKFSLQTHEELNSEETQIFEWLKSWRYQKAQSQKLPVYCIATNKELMSISKYKPQKKEELLEIKGFGKHKIEHYGQEIIEILENV